MMIKAGHDLQADVFSVSIAREVGLKDPHGHNPVCTAGKMHLGQVL